MCIYDVFGAFLTNDGLFAQGSLSSFRFLSVVFFGAFYPSLSCVILILLNNPPVSVHAGPQLSRQSHVVTGQHIIVVREDWQTAH